MGDKTILVTGIGGNVGQGILRNILDFSKSIKIVGTNSVLPVTSAHLCDLVCEVPYGDDPSYINVMSDICSKYDVSLILPSTDLESEILSGSKLSDITVTNPNDTIRKCNDKYLTYKSLSACGVEFAESMLPSEYQSDFTDFIAKPRKGRGSRGLMINPNSIDDLDDTYVIQKLYSGKEYTSSFYVDRDRNILSFITFERRLENGATVMCKVIKDFDPLVSKYIDRLSNCMQFKGSCNIQYMIEEGRIVPFEINCRISGTNSIRSRFGFEDIKWIIQEYLLNEKPTPKEIKLGLATRMLYDIISYGDTIDFADVNRNTENYIF